jgi:hypothetical protein
MSQSHVVSALLTKRSELMGILIATRRHLDTLEASLKNLDATIYLFNPDYNLADNKPKRMIKRNALFGNGELSRLILEVLRGHPDGLILSAINEQILKIKGLTLEQLNVVSNSTHKSLTIMQKRGQAIRQDNVWRLV